MKIVVERLWSDHKATVSRLTIFGETNAPLFVCLGLEDIFRSLKIRGETRIPAGRYRVTLRAFGGWHQRLKEMFGAAHRGALWIRDVPGFEDILIHPGNKAADTAGCYLPGRSALYQPQPFVTASRDAYKQLYAVAAGAAGRDDLTIEFFDLD